jgi:hypothetical protein
MSSTESAAEQVIVFLDSARLQSLQETHPGMIPNSVSTAFTRSTIGLN